MFDTPDLDKETEQLTGKATKANGSVAKEKEVKQSPPLKLIEECMYGGNQTLLSRAHTISV